ncbi:peroxidase family protein [Phormidium sp. CCY1219]|uniref:peroxidase family protein n=1 Tax=Phormidium sp. CCY1219 TaxID=2886104 RepID=UPI002D1F8192|nr:peroxidase family protein [Phormidium sp. CCY1219]MEB3827438.1 peptidoglycan-binding protein [Phormidium sp. CCY1219]
MPEQAYLHGRIAAPDPKEPKGQPRALAAIPTPERKTRFDNLFELPVFDPPGEKLIDLGASMKGDPEDNQQIPSGYTFVALFVDHDITFDPIPEFDLEIFKQVQIQSGEEKEPLNFRTPRIDMDSVYGRGPNVDRYLYDRKGDKRKLLIGGTEEHPIDVPRNHQNTAIIGDPRNDENLIISQLYLTFLKFHNAIVDYVDQGKVEDESIFENGADTDAFEKARQLAIWHYQWIVRYDLLPRIVDPEIIEDIVKNGRKLYRPEKEDTEPYIPHEFAVAAYRFGHSQVRTHYEINESLGKSVRLFELFRGDRVTEERAIDWPKFFEIDGSQPQYSQKIDTKITEALHDLPFINPKENQDPDLVDELEKKNKLHKLTDLAVRNLLRGVDLGLPSGEDVVRTMQENGIDVELKAFAKHLDLEKTPLWYYILKESEVEENGRCLGKVGGRIVGEVLIGLLELDPFSPFYTKANQNVKNWKPSLPADREGDFNAVDLIKFAGVRLLLLTEPYLTGSDVRRIQEKLNALSYIDIRVDGIYGPKTRDTVLEFQKQNNLNAVDGIVGPETRGALGLLSR